MKQYTKDVLDYLIQNAIESQFKFKTKDKRIGKLESRDNVLSLTFTENDTMVEKVMQFDSGKIIQLPEGSDLQEEVKKDIEDVNIITKREAYEWPDFARQFDNFVLDWFILDNVLTPDERIKHLLEVDWTNPPVYAKPLVIYSKENVPMYILGSKKIYNERKELIEPVGEERDLYNKWLSNAKDKFMKTKTTIFASMKKDSLMFNIENDTTIQIVKREKSISGRSCTTFDQPVLKALVEMLVGEAPPNVTKTKLCMFLDLVIRRAVLQEKEGLMWITPQEYDVLINELDNRNELLKKFK
jgi:hypothetical protein